MRLESCFHFDTEMFVKKLKDWKREKKGLEQRLESIQRMPSPMTESGIRGTEISNPTLRIAEKELEILEEIKDIERCEQIYDRVKKLLTPEELQIFCIFFEPKVPIGIAVDNYAHGNYTCRMNVYRQRRKLLKKMDVLIASML